MQWDKVKNILLVVLLLIDGFLGFTVASRYLSAYRQEKAFAADLSVVLARSGVDYSAELTVPTQSHIIPLEIDRNRAAEQAMAEAVLTGEVTSAITDAGKNAFAGDNGTVIWEADGTVRAVFRTENTTGDTARKLKQSAKALLQSCGVSLRGGTLTVDAAKRAVTLTATVAGEQVFNRSLTVTFGESGETQISGIWSFDLPYATTGEKERIYNVADVLLSFAAQNKSVNRIDGITLGYQMELDPSGRLRLVPTWRIATDQGAQYIDAGK